MTIAGNNNLQDQHIAVPKDIQVKVNQILRASQRKFFFSVPLRAVRLSTINKVQQEAELGIAITGKFAWSLF